MVSIISGKNEEIVKLNTIRKVMIKNLSKSINVAAQSTVVIEINMSEFEKTKEILRKNVERDTKIKLTYLPMFIFIISRVLTRHPILNSTLDMDREEIIRRKNINFGFAVAVERKKISGLVIPVIHKANKKNLNEIVVLVKQLASRAINGIITIEEMSGGTFTISSVGNSDVDLIQPLLRFPESAILGVTKVKNKPIVINKDIRIAPMSNFCLTVDHRIVDGVPTYNFLEDVKKSIEMIRINDFNL